jgi:hypothetical protein
MDFSPEFATIPDTCRLFGFGRTKLYELIAAGKVEARKLGARTLVRTASVRDFLDNAPRAETCARCAA